MTRDTFAIALSPATFDAVIFDLDGVITRTAAVHYAAWKALFDAYLGERAARTAGTFRPFDEADYRQYVDGRPRYEGVRSFLASRGIELPYGSPDDDPDQETVCGLGNRKNELFREHLARHEAQVYASSVELVRALKARGMKTAVVSSSQNCAAVLRAARLDALFDARVDGADATRLGFKGKPDPDTFLEAACRLGVEPSRAVVVEDAIAGVEAGRRGGFGCVIGVDRSGHAAALRAGGADVVVTDLTEVTVNESDTRADDAGLPSALQSLAEIARRPQGRRLAVFLDYDGTLTPIVERPELALLAGRMREAIERLARRCPVAILSGRDLADVRRRVGIDALYYAGSHGFDIAGPAGRRLVHSQDERFLPVLDQAEAELAERLAGIAGTLVERKRFSIAIHFRQVAEGEVGAVARAVDAVRAAHPELRKTHGKKIYELQPDIDWHKGRALRWLLEVLELGGRDVLPLFIGDDVTDEDAFRELREDGIGVVVTDHPRSSAARYALRDPEEVERFLEALARLLEENSR